MKHSRLTTSCAAISLLILILIQESAVAGKFNRVLDVGATAPTWENLIGIDGKPHSLADFKEYDVVVLFFTDNHCPMSRLYETRLKAFEQKFTGEKVALIAVNISLQPHETLATMKKHAEKREWTFDYLRDPTQKIGRDYGVVRTPQFFVLDRERKVAYMGSLDDNNDSKQVSKPYLTEAVTALLSGQRPSPGETLQRGCKIEFAESP